MYEKRLQIRSRKKFKFLGHTRKIKKDFHEIFKTTRIGWKKKQLPGLSCSEEMMVVRGVKSRKI